jgi:hypothetical protein
VHPTHALDGIAHDREQAVQQTRERSTALQEQGSSLSQHNHTCKLKNSSSEIRVNYKVGPPTGIKSPSFSSCNYKVKAQPMITLMHRFLGRPNFEESIESGFFHETIACADGRAVA